MTKKILIFVLSLFFCFSVFAQTENDLYSLILLQDDRFWIAEESIKILYSEDRKEIKKYYSDIESLNYYDDAEDKIVYWDNQSCFSCITIKPKLYRNQDVLCFTHGDYTDLLSFYFIFDKYENDSFYLNTKKTFNCTQFQNKGTFSKWPIKDDECLMILQFDGDYLYVYINDLKTMYDTFCRINEETLNEYNKLIKTNKCNLSNVTWPRHADGSCDYDNSSTTKTVAVQPCTNVSINKQMTVTENLKLRSGEATTTSVLTVMSAGTKVKILELGKAENIDGVNSNWVKVELQKGAKDRDGKEIKEGTVGWCYGGYLK